MRAGSNSSLPKTTVLVVEDSLSTAGIYKEFLRDEPLDVLHADTGKTAFSIIDEHCPRAILLDLGLPDMDGMQILEYVTERELPTSVVVITSRQSVCTAVDAMRAGAIDFIRATCKSPGHGGHLRRCCRDDIGDMNVS